MPTAGHRIVVTGASQGIGAAVAVAFAAVPGTRIALVARNRDGLHRTAAACAGHGADTVVVPCDVTDDRQVASAADTILRTFGAPTVLVNNAGAFEPGGVLELSAEAFRRQVDVNLTSAFLVTRSLLPAMIGAGGGHLVFMGSTASIKGYPSGAAYCAAKHGLLGLARSVREETRSVGIRVTTVLAGATLTPSWDGVDLPDERFMPAEDIAAAVVSACSMSDRTVVEELLVRPQLGDL